ncbi:MULTISPECIES: NUDIX hydrolase [Gordonia]|uniref:NUDIX domain-containing protein n=1 Tax=Gordonia amicalis TaxID=89053 RepID=A0ABU4DJQ0_9ACTN|nr:MULTISPECIES: NUDIX domain-containing protein [Gordonia]ATD71650.1 NUDIX domain-containing protein [Gordonia sp. 1D]MCR8900203.1 NUDIX domain-containing protein [Gordonia sp. GONU]MCZ4581087.1 NUDIX domain-containing protein [Gordonia amicalis]MCZ4650557.1 NUDIX domain-containing protein [Gordonia amicalis]MDJ0454756.1 NUDIX domain-containing protein [Gordonia amicalis]
MTAESLHASAVEALTAWQAPDSAQDSLRHAYLAFLAATPDACLRACAAGHLTGSAIVFDADRSHVLLTLHPRVGRWIQLGGHCEPTDETLAGAALREAREESGIPGLDLDRVGGSGGIVHLHTHPITCSLGVPTRHLDVRYRVVAAPTADGSLPAFERSEESVDLQWWPIDDLPADTDADIPELIRAALATKTW